MLRDLAVAPYGGSDVGEVLTIAAQVQPSNFDSFYSGFYNMAVRVYNTALNIDSCKFSVSARDAMFRASTYFRSADFYLHGNQSDPRINSLWVQQATAFDKGLSLLPAPGRRVDIEADGFNISAIWFPASQELKRRPVIIIGGGYDGGMEETYHQMGMAATARGWHAITYEGPGQATPRREQGLGFIVEWERVVTPVVDYLLTLPEVDASAIALVGLSFGGLLAPRASAFESRLAATIALDGLYEFGPLFLEQFPPTLTDLFNTGNATAFDNAVNAARSAPGAGTKFKWIIDQGCWAFATTSPFDWMTQLQAYTLENVIDKIPGPLFSADADQDIFFLGQGKILADKLGNRSTYYEFKAADGAGQHAGVGSNEMQNQVAYDWFQGILDSKI